MAQPLFEGASEGAPYNLCGAGAFESCPWNKNKKKEKSKKAVPPGTLPAETLGKCRVTTRPWQESLGLQGGRDERDRRWEGPSAAIGEAVAGEEKGRHALETTEAQVEMALWEISLSANRAGAWTPGLPSLAPGQRDCSVSKLGAALTAWKLTLTPWKQRTPPFHQEQKGCASQRALSFCLPALLLFCFVFSGKVN